MKRGRQSADQLEPADSAAVADATAHLKTAIRRIEKAIDLAKQAKTDHWQWAGNAVHEIESAEAELVHAQRALNTACRGRL